MKQETKVEIVYQCPVSKKYCIRVGERTWFEQKLEDIEKLKKLS